MKLKEYSKNQPCYYCGAPGPNGREHAPPKMMFAEFDCDSITVPSCDKHNTEKHNSDRAILTAIAMSALQMINNVDKWSDRLTPNVIAAIKLIEPNFHQAKNQVELRSVLVDPPDGLDFPLPYTQAGTNVDSWIKQLTAALVWSVVGRCEQNVQWDKAEPWSAGFITISEPITSEKAIFLMKQNDYIEQQFNTLSWYFGWSAYPKNYPADIYSFEICFPEDLNKWKNANVIFRHRFYNSTSVWYVWFLAPQEILNILVNTVNQKNY